MEIPYETWPAGSALARRSMMTGLEIKQLAGRIHI
jgi:hypothetical protein